MALVHLSASFKMHLAQARVPLRVTTLSLSSARSPAASTTATVKQVANVNTARIVEPPLCKIPRPGCLDHLGLQAAAPGWAAKENIAARPARRNGVLEETLARVPGIAPGRRHAIDTSGGGSTIAFLPPP